MKIGQQIRLEYPTELRHDNHPADTSTVVYGRLNNALMIHQRTYWEKYALDKINKDLWNL